MQTLLREQHLAPRQRTSLTEVAAPVLTTTSQGGAVSEWAPAALPLRTGLSTNDSVLWIAEKLVGVGLRVVHAIDLNLALTLTLLSLL